MTRLDWTPWVHPREDSDQWQAEMGAKSVFHMNTYLKPCSTAAYSPYYCEATVTGPVKKARAHTGVAGKGSHERKGALGH